MKDRKITCKCGSKIGPIYVGKVITADGIFFQWECDFCGQGFIEKVPEPLVIVEPDTKKEINFYKSI